MLNSIFKGLKLFFFLLLFPQILWSQVTIFSENIGTGTTTQAISATTFQNSSLTFSGTADTRTSTASTGYTGSSGGKNVFFTASGRDFLISGVNTTGYTSLTLSLGHYKPTTTANNELAIEVSSDGTTYTALSYSRATGTGTANWALVTPTGTIPATSNLRIRFTNGSSTQFRIDDIKLTGVVATSAPTLTTPTVASILTTSATLGATITDNGGASITSRGTVYGTATNPTGNVLAEGGTSVAAFTHSRTGLTANTDYHYRGYAINSAGTGYSPNGTFTTLPLPPTALAANSETSSGFTANWSHPTMGTATYTYTIEIDDDNTFASINSTINNIASGNTSQVVSGLNQNTTYYYRIKSINAQGSSAWSSTISVLTLSASSPALSLTPSSLDFGSECINVVSAALSFEISGTNLTSANITVSALSGFTFSTTIGGTYTNSLTLTQSGGSYTQMVYVKFSPTVAVSYSGTVTISGGGASYMDLNITATGINTSPSVSTIIATSITSNSFSSGGNSITNVCGTITSKGLVVGTSSNPTIASNVAITNDGTGIGNFTSAISALNPNALYYYRAYVTNSNGITAYGSQQSLTTLKNEPSNHASSFSCGSATTDSFVLTWTDAVGTDLPDGYLIKWSAVSYADISAPSDGSTSNGSNSTTVNHGVQSTTIGSLTQGTDYYFKIWPYSNSGSSIDYKTNGTFPQSSCTTLQGPCLEESFTSTTFPPTGWLSSNTARSTNAADYNTSPAGATFSSTNGTLTTTEFSYPTTLKFYLGRSGNTTAKTFNVKISTTSQSAGFTTVATYDHSNVPSSSYNQYTVDLSAYNVNSSVWIQFEKVSSTTAPWRFDDVEVTCSAPVACVTPSSDATSLILNAISATEISGSFTLSTPVSDAYLVVRYGNSTTTPEIPVDGTPYAIGNTIGSGINQGTVIDIDANNTFSSSGLTSSTSYKFYVFPYNNVSCVGGPLYKTNSPLNGVQTTNAAQPEINVKQVSTNYLNASTYNFANTGIGVSTDVVFTVENLGLADLNISSVAVSGTGFSLESSPSSTITANNTSTFTVRFSPNAISGFSGSIVINSNDADESVYAIQLSGNGVGNALSDIIFNAASAASNNQNIDYLTYQSATISNTGTGTGGSVGVMAFTVRDGGSAGSDVDNLSTELNAISFSVTNVSNVRSAALFNGTTFIQSVAVNGVSPISFTGLSGSNVTCADNSTLALSLRITFNSSVTDNQKLIFSVASASASSSGSSFATANAGGAASDNSGNDINRTEVNADRLIFTVQPVGNTASVNLPSFTVSAADANQNIDLDANLTITLSSNGTGFSSSSSYFLTNGNLNITDVQYSTAQTNINITAQTTGLSFSNTVTSNNFDIEDVPANSYRTIGSGTWPNSGTATWQRFVSGSWTSASAPSANTVDYLYINHTITVNAAFAATGGVGTKMIIDNGGYFVAGNTCTFGELLIKSGGTLEITNPAVDILATTGTVTVDSGGTVILNSATLNNADGFWEGIENFKSGSTLRISNWDWNSATGEEGLIDSNNEISTNANGYYFGNIVFNSTPTDKIFSFVRIIGNHKLCENDLTVSNQGTTYNVTFATVNANVEIGGNVTCLQNTLSFATVTGSNLTHTIKGNLIASGGTINLNQGNSASASVTLNLNGNLQVNSGSTITSTDEGCTVKFTGDTVQTISIAGTLGTNLDFEVASASHAQFINQNFSLTNASNTFKVASGGILDFNNYVLFGSGIFELESAGELYITSVDGINASGTNTGVLQNTGTRTINQLGYFHFTGNSSPQSTGNALTSGSTAKKIIINKSSNSNVVNLSQSTGISNELIIKKGIFVETNSANVNGSGSLIMEDGVYQTALINTTLPQLSGSYSLTGGTIELNAAGNQTLRGSRAYRDLIFSNSGNKLLSSGITSITGTVYIKDNAFVDAENKSLGGTGTNLTMSENGHLIVAGTGTKPDASGTYTLGLNTKIEFNNSAASSQNIRIAPTYANIIVSGKNVANSSSSSSLNFMVGGSFTVKTNALFKVNNSNGFSGSSNTAISSSNNPTITLENGSWIEYAASGNQIFTDFAYEKVKISGSGIKTFDSNISSEVILNDTLLIESASLNIGLKQLTLNGDLIINADTGLVLKSTGLEPNENASLVTNGVVSGTGSARVERFLNCTYCAGGFSAYGTTPAGRTWHVVSPVAGATSETFQAILTDHWMYSFNPQTNSYTEITDNTTALDPARAYVARVQNNEAFSYEGLPNSGNVTYTVNNVPSGRYILTGNPFTSAIEWDSAGLSGLLNRYWFNTGHNTFVLYDGITGIATPAPDIASPSIPEASSTIASGKGFWVRAIGTNPGNVRSITFHNNKRQHNAAQNFSRAAALTNPKLRVKVRNLAQLDKIDDTVIRFDDQAVNGLDERDSQKMYSTNNLYPQVFTKAGNQESCINSFGDLTSTVIVPLGFKTSIPGNYMFEFPEIENFASNVKIYIEDLLLQEIYQIKHGIRYKFSTSAVNSITRFRIIFDYGTPRISLTDSSYVASNFSEELQNNALNISEQGEDKMITVTNVNALQLNSINNYSGELVIIDLSGKIVFRDRYETNSQQLLKGILNTGVYYFSYFNSALNHSGKLIITE